MVCIFFYFFVSNFLNLIINKAEGSARQICIDQTEVSNLQFLQYVKETKYQTQVIFDFILI